MVTDSSLGQDKTCSTEKEMADEMEAIHTVI